MFSRCDRMANPVNRKIERQVNPMHRPAVFILGWSLLLAGGIGYAPAGEVRGQPVDHFRRQVTFELTYSHRDLIWLGDPASPTASLYIKPGARPVASDLCVTTLIESSQSPGRRYLREARIAAGERQHTVYAFTKFGERAVGIIDDQGRFSPNGFYVNNRALLPTWPADASTLAYDAQQNALYYEVDVAGPCLAESLDFLPLELVDSQGNPVVGQFSINVTPYPQQESGKESATASLVLRQGQAALTLARATLPRVLRQADVQLGSFDNATGSYLSEDAYRANARSRGRADPMVTLAVAGEFTAAIESDRQSLVVAGAVPSENRAAAPARISIDGNFDDWRNTTGVDDPRGDLVPYLEYVPDVDLLEFKVAHDDEHIYLYARVAGQVGRSRSAQGRSYFYAYMDVDRNPGTGFLPTRDDDCYFGVDIGDDCEVQFEFVDSKLRKTFYGFCGLGGNDNVLRQQVTIGKSHYARFDDEGNERPNYKSEYIYRNGVTEITEDLKLGTSDTIHVALSPDGSEVEVASSLAGFLKDPKGRPTVAIGQTIDLAVGMECDTRAYPGEPRWGADSTRAIRGYHLRPVNPQRN